MIVVIAGGNLQGVEAVYLAKKAGWETIVLDKRPHPPASGMCDRFIQIDVVDLTSVHQAIDAIQRADFILPALENDTALAALSVFSETMGIPLAHCPEAYAISSSKLKSDALFETIGIPAPIPWPACGFPAIGKPDSASGSDGITIFHDQKAWEDYRNRSDQNNFDRNDSERKDFDRNGSERKNFDRNGSERKDFDRNGSERKDFDRNDSERKDFDRNDSERKDFDRNGSDKGSNHVAPLPVMQQYIEGPSYSMEVMGQPGRYVALETTELFMDEMYDCCRVTAPVALPHDLVQQFEDIAIDLAEAVNLKGIMDVEVILHDGELKVLEIDARIPSQTPTAVYHATGINMVELLGEIFSDKGQWHSAVSNGREHQPMESSNNEQDKTDPVSLSPFMERGSGGEVRGQVTPDQFFTIPQKKHPPIHVSYEHIRVTARNDAHGTNHITFAGEHIMSIGRPLFLKQNFFGADEAITNYRSGLTEFVATLVFTALSPEGVEKKRSACFHEIQHAEL